MIQNLILDFSVNFLPQISNLDYMFLLQVGSLINEQIHGPFVRPFFLGELVRIYNPPLDRKLISTENKNHALIYQWTNLINGKIYIGSASTGSIRLLKYFSPSMLMRNLPIYNSLNKYGHNNFCLAILDDLGSSKQVAKTVILEREQFYINILFENFPKKKLNLLRKAGSLLHFKHSAHSKLKMKGKTGPLNPMYGKKGPLHPTYGRIGSLHPMFGRKGILHPGYGKKHSSESKEKMKKKIFVYDMETYENIGVFGTHECIKHFKMGQSTLFKYLDSGLPYKGRIFSRVPIDFSSS